MVVGGVVGGDGVGVRGRDDGGGGYGMQVGVMVEVFRWVL